MAKEIVIVSACRTAIGKFMGTLSSLSAPQLGGKVIKSAVERAGIKNDIIDEVIMGCVVQGGLGQAPARQAAINAGLPSTISAFTINKVCGSGLKAVMLASQAIKAGEGECIVAGGFESMSNVPYYLDKARYSGYKYGDGKLIDGLIHDGLFCAFAKKHMGFLGDFTAKNSNITRKECDEFSYNSQKKAAAAMKSGVFKNEIIDVEIPQRKKDPIVFNTDEGVRETTPEILAKLPAVFEKDGVITPGNASQLSDGASASVVMSKSKAEELNIKPLAKIVGYSDAHIETNMLFYAPETAIKKLLTSINWDINTVDLWELNEAFSSQAVANAKNLGIPSEKINVNGGAIALGHPIGASGTRVLTTLIYALKNKGLKKGVTSLCLGGGGAVAMAIEII